MASRKATLASIILSSFLAHTDVVAQEANEMPLEEDQESFAVEETDEVADFLYLLRAYSNGPFNCNHPFYGGYSKEAIECYNKYIKSLSESEIPRLDKDHPDKKAFLEQADRLIYLGDNFIKAKMLYKTLNEDISLEKVVENLQANLFYIKPEEFVEVVNYLKKNENKIPKEKLIEMVTFAFSMDHIEKVSYFFEHLDFSGFEEKFFEDIDKRLVKKFYTAERLYNLLGTEIPISKLIEKKMEILTESTVFALPYFERKKIPITIEEWYTLAKTFADPENINIFFNDIDRTKIETALYLIERMKANEIIITDQFKKEIHEMTDIHLGAHFELIKKFYDSFNEEIPDLLINTKLEKIIYNEPQTIKYLKERKIAIGQDLFLNLTNKFITAERLGDALILIEHINNPSEKNLILWGQTFSHRTYIPYIKKGLEFYKKANYRYDKEELKKILNCVFQSKPTSEIWLPEEFMDAYLEINGPKDERSDIFVDDLEHLCSYREPTITYILKKTGIKPSKERLIELGQSTLTAGYFLEDIEKIVEITGKDYSENDYFYFAERMLKREMQTLPIYLDPLEKSQIFHWGIVALKKSKKKDYKLFEKHIEPLLFDFEINGEDVFEAFSFFGINHSKEIFKRINLQKEKLKEIEFELEKQKDSLGTDETIMPVEKIYADLIAEAKYVEKIDEKSAIDLREFILKEMEKKDISEGIISHFKKGKETKRYLIELGDRLFERGAFKQAKLFYNSITDNQ